MQKVFQQGLVKSSSDYRKCVQTLNRQVSQHCEVALSNLENFLTEELNVIHVTAQHRTFPLAAYLTYTLSHLSVPNILLDCVGSMFTYQCKTVRKGDVVLAVSFSPYANKVLKLVEVVQERKVPVIVITDSVLSPLAPFSDFVWK